MKADFGFLKTINAIWLQKLKLAKEARQPWEDVARQCEQFFFGSTRFMWEKDFRTKFIGTGIETPKFQITMNKAFEFVAIYGPNLFWRYPNRRIKPYEPLDVPVEAFGDPRDPQAVAAHQAAQFEQSVEYQSSLFRCGLRERYLNYSQREQPAGGRAQASKLGITDMCVTGRGLAWPQTYQPPGSDRSLTGCFWGSVFELFVDPDSKDPTLSDATWIARKHFSPHWELERRFGLPAGSLKKAAKLDSTDETARKAAKGTHGGSHDLVPWFEVWSRCGIGLSMKGVADSVRSNILARQLEETIGDYAYLCICDCDYPLNLRQDVLEQVPEDPEVTGEDIVREAVAWPFETWRDNRWPVAVLDAYQIPGCAWPLAPIAPGLGQLIAINVMTSAFVEMAYENRKQIVAYLGSVAQDVETALKSKESIAFLKLNESVQKSITDCIQFLKRPDINFDLLNAIDYMSDSFNKAVGLPDRVYSMEETQDRSATGSSAKERWATIRMDDLAKSVAAWESEAATLEGQLATLELTGADVSAVLGSFGGRMWDQVLSGVDPELVMRELRATVEASDIRKPDKDAETANLQQMLQFMLPMLQAYAMQTGDSAPLNAFVAALGDSMEQKTADWMLGPWVPAPPPQDEQAAAAQQAMMQAELDNKNSVTELNLAKAGTEQVKQQVLPFEAEAKAEGERTKAQLAGVKTLVDADMKVRDQRAKAKQAVSSPKK